MKEEPDSLVQTRQYQGIGGIALAGIAAAAILLSWWAVAQPNLWLLAMTIHADPLQTVTFRGSLRIEKTNLLPGQLDNPVNIPAPSPTPAWHNHRIFPSHVHQGRGWRRAWIPTSRVAWQSQFLDLVDPVGLQPSSPGIGCPPQPGPGPANHRRPGFGRCNRYIALVEFRKR